MEELWWVLKSFLDKFPEKSADYVAIASIDSLFALPDFRIRERIMHLLINIKSKATENLLIQGRNLDSSVIEQGLSGDLSSFYKEEIKLREKFSYPRFQSSSSSPFWEKNSKSKVKWKS